MADRYAPALFLEVLAFWFILRWFLFRRAILLVGWLLVVMMLVGALSTLDEHSYTWTACFVGAALLAWILLHRWRGRPPLPHPGVRPAPSLAWRGKSGIEVAALCERRIGLPVDAAAPATLAGRARSRCVLALAGDGLWIIDDESRPCHPRVGRVLACWDRTNLVAHVQHSRRGEDIELSWPRHGALVRGRMRSGEPADLMAGHLIADELTHRSCRRVG